MEPLRILVSMGPDPEGPDRILQLLPPGSEVVSIPWMHKAEDVAPETLRGAHALFCEWPPANVKELTDLRWIQLNSVGFSQLHGLGLPERGVRVTNARGTFDAPIAEWCIAMMINLARDLPGMFRNQQGRVWDGNARFQGEIRGATVGIYGYGGIGRETARLAKCLGLRVWVLSRGPIKRRELTYRVEGTGDPEGVLPDRVFAPDEKLEFLSGLDYLVLAVPLSAKTRGIIGAAELAALPKTAAILNPARGPLIDEQALLQTLRERRIKAAALDTHFQYPLPPEHPLWGMDNVILTPHISGSSLNPNFLARTWEIFALNVKRFIVAEPLINEVAAADLCDA